MTEIIDFLTELSTQRKTQDIDVQANPRFWVIEDYRDQVVPEGYHDDICIFDADACHEMTPAEYIDEINERIQDGEFDQDVTQSIKNAIDSEDYDNIIYYAGDEQNVRQMYTAKQEYIVPNTFFLTKQEAKDYLKKYGYNHTSKAHTYAMTGLRSPSFETLINLIDGLTDDNGQPLT